MDGIRFTRILGSRPEAAETSNFKLAETYKERIIIEVNRLIMNRKDYGLISISNNIHRYKLALKSVLKIENYCDKTNNSIDEFKVL